MKNIRNYEGAWVLFWLILALIIDSAIYTLNSIVEITIDKRYLLYILAAIVTVVAVVKMIRFILNDNK